MTRLPDKDVPYIWSIDPGMTGSGIAAWSIDLWPEPHYPVCWNVFPAEKCDSWIARALSVVNRIMDKALNSEYAPCKVYCEMPVYFDDAKGEMAAKEASFTKLVYFVGMLHRAMYMSNIPFIQVPVREWKGHLPKKVVEDRIKLILPEIKALSHSWDAIGIGLHAMKPGTISNPKMWREK